MKSIWNWVKKSPVFFLLLYFLVGCATIKQYGLPLDDFTQYVIGKVNYEYINGERTNEEIEVDMRYSGPALWLHPLSEFATLVHRMQAFPWPNETLIAGEFVGPTHRVWWYLPVWFSITMPVAYLLLFLGSVIAIFLSLKNKMKQFSLRDALLLFFLLLFLLNIGLVMFTKPILYDSWRQFQFLIVPFLIVSGVLISKLISKKYFLNGMKFILVYQFCVLIYLNPAQYVYFNEYYWLFGERNTYDQDYWSVSTEHCVDWLDRQKFNKPIYIYTAGSNTGWLNLFFYQNNQNRQFFIADSLKQADFEIETIRNRKPFDPKRKVVYSLVPLKDTVARIIQLK